MMRSLPDQIDRLRSRWQKQKLRSSPNRYKTNQQKNHHRYQWWFALDLQPPYQFKYIRLIDLIRQTI